MELDRRELQCILNSINENIFFKDTNGRYILSTHVCNMLNSNGDPDFSIYGKTDLDIQPDKTLGKKFYEEDMNIIKTKNNVNYIEKMQFGEEVFYYQINKNPVLDADGNVMGIVGIVKDISDLIKLQEKLKNYSITDMMTQTYNRSFYESGEYINKLKYPVGVVMADINNLKYYNDNYGHKEGDILIRTIVNNMQRYIRPADVLIRLGGDEFLILLQECDKKDSDKIINQIKSAEGNIKLQNITVGTSYGISIANNEEELNNSIAEADKAMYADKRKSKKILKSRKRCSVCFQKR